MTGTRRRLEGEGPQGRHALDQRDLRHQARRLVGVDGDHGRLHGRRPARARTPTRSASTSPASRPTGTCAENNNHGGGRSNLPDPRKLADGTDVSGGVINILDFKYALGDLSLAGQGQLPPVISRASRRPSATSSSGKRLYHSITSCKAPCTGKTGIAYPLADGKVQFESNTLGTEHSGGRPDGVDDPGQPDAGTYTYFCRIHPFMRGAFRVK